MDDVLLAWRDRGSFVDLDGLRLFVQQFGDGPTVLALHGYPFGAFDFSSTAPLLSRRHRVVAPDLPGFGFSDKPDRLADLDLRSLTDLVERLAQELELREAHVLAFDLGTAIAQELIARQVEGRGAFSLRTVCCLNGSLFPELYRPRLIQRLLASSLGPWLGPRVPRRSFDRALRSVCGPDTPLPDELLERCWQLHQHGHGARLTHLMNRLIFSRREHRDRWVAAMQKTDVPLCLVNGPADPNSGQHMMDRWRQLLPRAAVVSVGPRIGHFPLLEAPVATAAAITAFWERY